MKIAVTHHDAGRSFRQCRDRAISMRQALDIHDPFVSHDTQLLAASRPCWTWGFKIRLRVAASRLHSSAL